MWATFHCATKCGPAPTSLRDPDQLVATRLSGLGPGFGWKIRRALGRIGAPWPRKLTVNVGITGHRACLLPAKVIEALEPVLEEVFGALRDAAVSVGPRRGVTRRVQLRLHTPLASGADQIAAKSAHASGYRVHALLPFEADEYRKDFAAGRELDDFEEALRAAHKVRSIAGERSDEIAAYVSVGQAVVDAADILIAVWDGGEGNGPGGTAHVVGLALESAMPVIHIAIDREQESVTTRLLVGGETTQPVVRTLSGTEAYRALVKQALPSERRPS